MTKAEYAAYEKAVAEFMRREGIETLNDNGEEGAFSWSPCHCCGTSLGGNRHTATGFDRGANAIYHYEICQDCVYYAAYGQLDDMTMMEMEDTDASK